MPNSTRSANQAMSIIARRIAERAAAYLAPADEIGPMCEMVTTFLDQMMAGISSTEASRLLYRMIDRIDFLGDHLLENVNPPAQGTAFQDHIGQVFARFDNGRSIHLELGVWTSWPEERVQQRVGPDKLGDIIRLDMNPTFPVDVAASVTALPFRDNSIDCISSDSLFEHVPYPHDILREAFRVLRAGGALRTTVPFHFVEHGCPKDYLRFTAQFFEDVCADIGFTDIKTDTRSTSGMLYTIHQLSKAALVNRDAPDAEPARRAHVAIMSILGVCQALDSSFVAGGASHWHTTMMIAIKPGNYVAPDSTPDHSKHFLDRHHHILACPLTGDPLIRQGETLVTRRGASYKIVNGVPNMVMMQGQSSFSVIAKRLDDLQRKQHYPMSEGYSSLFDESFVLAARVANLESERAELAERNYWMGRELIRAGISLPWSEEQSELSEVSRQVLVGLITSTSWRLTRPLRGVVRFLNGGAGDELVAESIPPTLAERQRLIGELRRSTSWRVALPLRVIGRLLLRLGLRRT